MVPQSVSLQAATGKYQFSHFKTQNKMLSKLKISTPWWEILAYPFT